MAITKPKKVTAAIKRKAVEIEGEEEKKRIAKRKQNAELVKSRFLSPTMNLPPPRAVIEFEKGERNYPVFTLGNISLIQGKAKSRKTTFLSALVAALAGAIAGGVSEAFDNFFAVAPEGKTRVVWFDTEQSNYHSLRTLKRSCRLSGLAAPPINFSTLREFDPATRCELIEDYLSVYALDIGIVIIDGVRDLLFDINDNKESTVITSKLLEWSQNYDLHIVTVLHENKGDRNSRGVIGTELWNKSETVIRVEANDDGESSTVECVHSRDRSFDSFVFRVDEEGVPFVDPFAVPEVKTSLKNARTASRIDDLSPSYIMSRLTSFMSESEPTTYERLILGIRESFEVGDTIAKRDIKPLLERKKFITKKEGSRGYWLDPTLDCPF